MPFSCLAAAKQLKGIYDRGQPLLQLGTVFAVSIAASLVPSISKAVHGNKPFIIKEKATTARQSLTADVAFSFMINGLFPCTAFEIEGTNDAAILTANTVPS